MRVNLSQEANPFRPLRRGSQLANLTDTLSRHMRFLNLRYSLLREIYNQSCIAIFSQKERLPVLSVVLLRFSDTRTIRYFDLTQ